MRGIEFMETVITRIIQINITLYDDTYDVTPMGSFGTGKFIFSTDIDSSDNTYVCDYDDDNMPKSLSIGTFILKCKTIETGKFIFSTDAIEMVSAENLYIADFGMKEGKNLHHDKID